MYVCKTITTHIFAGDNNDISYIYNIESLIEFDAPINMFQILNTHIFLKDYLKSRLILKFFKSWELLHLIYQLMRRLSNLLLDCHYVHPMALSSLNTIES